MPTAAAAKPRVTARVVRVMIEQCLTLHHGENSQIERTEAHTVY